MNRLFELKFDLLASLMHSLFNANYHDRSYKLKLTIL